jgi:hypothetical protein
MWESEQISPAYSNMLTIVFATRTDSTLDPLTERALALTQEYISLTGGCTPYIFLIAVRVS